MQTAADAVKLASLDADIEEVKEQIAKVSKSLKRVSKKVKKLHNRRMRITPASQTMKDSCQACSVS